MFFEVSADLVIDGGVGGNASRFINHSCEPNCVVEIAGNRVHIHAAREIAPGEELTFDYAYEWEARYRRCWSRTGVRAVRRGAGGQSS